MKSISRIKFLKYLTQLIGSYLIVANSSCSWFSQKQKTITSPDKEQLFDRELIQVSGYFLTEVNRLKKLALPKNSYLYQIPTASHLKRFGELAKALINQDFNSALNLARELNYEVVRFVDTSTQQIFYGVREKLINGEQSRGWGSYFINTSYSTNALIEVPHIIADQQTEKIGAKTFLMASARGFLIAGAHRNANGYNTADVCNPISSIFQAVHEAWVLSGTKVWQIHGFRLANHPNFPSNTQAVLSDGQGTISPEVLDLSQQMGNSNFQPYVYNNLSPSAPLNRQVNQGIKGTIFSSLGGRQNVQGIYCHRQGNAFIHVELARSIRNNKTGREQIAKCLADSIKTLALT